MSAVHLEVTQETRHALADDVFGQFLERPSWGGEHGPEAVCAPDGTLPDAVISRLGDFHTRLVRFPFGTDGDYLDWRDMTDLPGRAERPVSTGHLGDRVSNRFGYPEYFQLADRMGWQTILVTNLRDALYLKKPIAEAAIHAAELVRHVRQLPGKPRIRAVQVGNEGWFFWPPKPEEAEGIGIQSDQDAILRLRQALVAYADAIHAVDANLPLIADAPRPVDGGGLENNAASIWRAAVDHESIRSRYAMLAAHAYAPLGCYGADRDGEKLEPVALTDDEIWFGMTSTPGRFDSKGLSVADAVAYDHIKELGFRVAVTEWNWNGWNFDGAFPDSKIDIGLASALGTAGFLHGMMRSPDVELATQSMMLGVHWGIAGLLVGADKSITMQHQAQVVSLHARHHGDRILKSNLNGNQTIMKPVRMATWWPQTEHLALVDAVVSADADALYIHWMHRGRESALEMDVQLPETLMAGKATSHILAGAKGGKTLANYENTVDFSSSTLRILLPPASLGVTVVPYNP